MFTTTISWQPLRLLTTFKVGHFDVKFCEEME